MRPTAYVGLSLSLALGLALLALHNHQPHTLKRPRLGGAPCPPPAAIFNNNTEESVRVAADASAATALSDFFGAGSRRVPVGVAFSGGGWKALAQHMGVARAIADLGFSMAGPQPRDSAPGAAAAATSRVLASNSGGSWFLALLGYSPRFAAAVQTPTSPTSPTIGAAYGDFMTAYATLASDRSRNETADVRAAAAKATWRGARAGEALPAIFDTLPMLNVAIRFGNSWQAFIEAMLDAYQPGITSLPVGAPTNPSLQGAALVFHFTLASSSYLIDQGGKEATGSIRFGATARAREPIPAHYSTRTSQPWVPLDTGLAVVALDGTEQLAPFSQALPSAPMRLGLVAAASSAAAGMLGSKDMMEQARASLACRLKLASTWARGIRRARRHGAQASAAPTDAEPEDSRAVAAQGLSNPVDERTTAASERAAGGARPVLSLEEQAPCSDGTLHACRFPSVRLMDGYLFDNTGIVAALAELQQRGPAEELRLLASVANTCVNPPTPPFRIADCMVSSGNNQLEKLFANLPVAPSGVRYPSEAGAAFQIDGLGGSTEGTRAFSARVFAERLPTDWRAHGGDSAFRTLTLNVTTVDNPAGGVRAGSRVTLLLLFGNVPPSCPVGQLPGVDAQTVAACAALADAMRAFVYGMGKATSIGSYVVEPAARSNGEEKNESSAAPQAPRVENGSPVWPA